MTLSPASSSSSPDSTGWKRKWRQFVHLVSLAGLAVKVFLLMSAGRLGKARRFEWLDGARRWRVPRRLLGDLRRVALPREVVFCRRLLQLLPLVSPAGERVSEAARDNREHGRECDSDSH
ncbi:MAG: hypothetical protein BJ554DRAFT_90 [Olpidium bornovanus]|uniref:Uncharacterized protein n=1 Tax=Olpidium bornovanus TaxID=278681 RepID=A0A8H8DII0_9FUNG|nr:MAG: hypothetical protein BJ554DRAFT_90 [Olpidium bornovanus]